MSLPSRVVSMALLVLFATTLGVSAQTSKKTSSSKKTTKVEKSKYHRLPAYYGKLKLKADQVEEIYKIKDSFGPKIDDLMKELADLKEEQAEEIKDVLTRTQVTALNKLKAAGASSSSSKSKSTSSKKK